MPDPLPNTRIKKLSPLLINQLAAGEVVTRPAAVVKELLENAIDAGATKIDVHITQGGMGMIEVVDNGVGIHPDDMVMAITRHATSKVADVANLEGITTLGFRGEALAATAAVSRLTLSSSHDESGVGRQLQVAGVLDDIPKLIPVVHHRGTTITVKDLYFNVPARRGNLKSMATEFAHIEAIVREVALAQADVALNLFHDHKKRLSLLANTSESGNNNRLPLSRLEQATGTVLKAEAIEVLIDLSSLLQQPSRYTDKTSLSQASINGWLWPMMHNSVTQQAHLPKLLYVNGRLIKEPIIANQLRQLAQNAELATIGYALYFELPTQWLNINVHPSKQRIKISPLNNIMAHVNHVIQSKLKNIAEEDKSAKSDEALLKAHSSINQMPINYKAINKPVPNAVSANQSYSSLLATQQDRQINRQVKASKQNYQLSSDNTCDAQFLEVEGLTVNGREDSASLHMSSSKLPIQTVVLPYCLEVIYPDTLANLKSLAAEPIVIETQSLPWLLFYSQGQCLIINGKVWQSQLSGLFESEISRNIEQKNLLSISAATINQHLACLAQQMSAQDLLAFSTDIEGLLSKHALNSISSERLVALMLSSTSE